MSQLCLRNRLGLSGVFCVLLLSVIFSITARADIWDWPWEWGSSNSSGASKTSVQNLPALGGDVKAVSVSGLSAGAYMAVQIHIAYSSSLIGVGVIAGGPWMCSNGDAFYAQGPCMETPDDVDVPSLVAAVKKAQALRQIDAVSNLGSAHVYVFNSPVDDVVREPMNAKTVEFYSSFVPAAQIHSEQSIKSAHGMPTLSFGRACNDFGDPYFNKCGFDTAGETLKVIYSDRAATLQRSVADPTSLHLFDQTEFGSAAAMMGQTGWVYVPQKCAVHHSNCPVHVALHGCLQTPDKIKDTFAVHAGYNEWAEGSGIIVLYPQAETSLMNPKGCYDWWGYTGSNFATKSGLQMRAIKAMMDRLTGL